MHIFGLATSYYSCNAKPECIPMITRNNMRACQNKNAQVEFVQSKGTCAICANHVTHGSTVMHVSTCCEFMHHRSFVHTQVILCVVAMHMYKLSCSIVVHDS